MAIIPESRDEETDREPSVTEAATLVRAAASRGTPVQAAAAGTVEFAGSKIGYGTIVIIDHGAGYITRYAHLDSITVEQGQLVTQTQPVGTVGSSGYATTEHLHFEVLYQGDAMSPHPFIPEWER